MHICKFEEFFVTKKTKRWSPTTKTTYKKDLTLKMLFLHLYESTILTLWIHSSKIRVNDADSYTKWCCIFILKLLCYRDWSTHFLYKKSQKRIIFRLCSQNYLFWYRNVFKNHLWSYASLQKEYSNILQHQCW